MTIINKAALAFGLLSLSILGFNGTALAAGDALKGEQLSQICLGCHGAPGLRNPGPVYSIPMIGGQHADYIISSLKAYKSKERGHGTMRAQASNLSDQDMADIAEFFSSMEGNSRPSLVNKRQAALGQKASATCAACHGATGDGDNSIYPKLAGQYESYLAQALKDYRSGERKNPIMSGFSAGLTAKDIKALAAWFASQEGGLSAPKTKLFK
ncbi:MAG: cytochrome c553 [Cryomorphaceae bacterium]|jgi:cytochrome c553